MCIYRIYNAQRNCPSAVEVTMQQATPKGDYFKICLFKISLNIILEAKRKDSKHMLLKYILISISHNLLNINKKVAA